MAAWHRLRRADIGLRAIGLLLGGIGYCAIRRLVALDVPPQSAGVIACGLAALAFLGASIGGTMLMLGHHLFDEVPLSPRWRVKRDALPASPPRTRR